MNHLSESGDVELEAVAVRAYFHRTAAFETAEQDFIGEPLLELVLDEPCHRPGAELVVEAVLGQPFASVVTELELDLLFEELRGELSDELVDDSPDHFARQRIEADPRIESIAELWRERALDRLLLRGAALPRA